MKVETRTIYQCEYCPKYYKMKHFAMRHEKICHKNPDNQHLCWDCRHLDITTQAVDIGDDYYSMEPMYITALCYICKVKNIELYPFKAERSKLVFKGDKTRMPSKECSDFWTK